jgi:alkylhydroperoxidase/carboxymuconolactone decarboxylase family protein YurZ
VYNIYSGIYGYDEGVEAAKENEMTDEEYENTVTVAAEVAVNPIANGLLSAGAFGEKALKALVVTAEDALKAAGTWIDEQSQEFDSRYK